jgi:drug/metabolite transporter (DMT)-like permease
MKSQRIVADTMMIMVTFFWGVTFVMVQDAIFTLAPFSFLTLRFAIAFLLLALFTYLSRSVPHLTAAAFRSSLQNGFVLGLWSFLGYALQTFSLLYTTSGKTGFLTGLNVAIVPILSFFILGTRIKSSSIAGVVCAVIGLYLLAFTDFSAINHGDLLAFGCAISFAFQIVYTGKYAPLSSLFHLVTIQMATITAFSFLFALLFEPWQQMFNPAILLSPSVLIAVSVTSTLATTFAYIAQTYVQRFTTPTRIALIFAIEPVFAALADYGWKGVIISGTSLVGCLLILCGMILSEMRLPRSVRLKRRRKEKM